MAQPNVIKQIRRFCMQCQGNSSADILGCKDVQCVLWPWRLMYNTAQDTAIAQKEALRHVRKHCLQCAEDKTEVRHCTARDDCPLWSLRFGVYPATYRRVKERCTQAKRLSLFNY